MTNVRLMAVVSLLLGLAFSGRSGAQSLYYGTTSATTGLNTLDTVATNGTSHVTLLTASGVDGNKLNRCTAVAVDLLNGRLFVADGSDNELWSYNLNGGGLTLVKSGLPGFPTDVALDVINQRIFYTTSSTVQSSNTVQRVDYTGSNNVTVFTATGSAGNGVSRCTALAVDIARAKIFVTDAGSQEIWSLSLNGTNLARLTPVSAAVPTDLALDVTNQLVYVTLSSPVQSQNSIQRMTYSGANLTNIFNASGSVERCTGLDLDLSHGEIYLADAGASELWSLPIAGGSSGTAITSLPAVAKKVRWYNGLNTLPHPGLTGIQFSGTNTLLNAMNGLAGGIYYLLTNTNMVLPVAQWQPVATNVLTANGNFTLSAGSGLISKTPQQFFILQLR